MLPDVPTKLPADTLPVPVKLPAPSNVQVYAPLTISTFVPEPTKLPVLTLPVAVTLPATFKILAILAPWLRDMTLLVLL